MANYQTIPVAAPKRSQQKNNVFSVGTTDFGRLQPVGTFEVVPGDKVSLSLKTFVRAAPPSTPVYGRIKVHTDAFFVPYRILWSDWNNYIAGLTDSTPPYTTIELLNKQVNSYNVINAQSAVYESEQKFQLAQDLERVLAGLKYPRSVFAPPPAGNPDYLKKRISLFPWRAFKQIWWDYYRDSVNINEATKSSYLSTGGAVASASFVDNVSNSPQVLYRCFGKDYLTTALPSANGGNSTEQVRGALAPTLPFNVPSDPETFYDSQNFGNVPALSSRPHVPIQALRAANALQRYMEKNNIVGTRLLSRLLARFGVAPSAERLQRAEYLGSNVFTMKVNDIDSSESTDIIGETSSEQLVYNAFGSSESFANIRGQATGKITGGGNSQSFNYSATEHGIIIILQSIMPDESYYQGLDRSMIRGLSTPNADRFDFFTPEFENLGYQPVLASDVYMPERGDQPNFFDNYDPNKVFGYQPRYSDYKFMRHMLFGDFTSSIFNTGMDAFHLFRDLSFFGENSDQQEMVISAVFNQLGVAERLQFDRIFQIPSTKITVNIGDETSSTPREVTATLDHFQLYNSISYSANRPMTGDDMPELVAGENASDGKHISVPTGGIRM